MSEINLTRATRDTIATLRSAIDDARTASQRIATGLKINSAMENPTAFFNSKALSARAEELDRSLEQVSQGVQVVKAAYDGLEGIRKLADNARAVIGQAAAADSPFGRATFAANYNAVLEQIEDLARDSGYQGKNLLLGAGNDVKLYFGDRRTDAVQIEAVNYGDIAATLGLPRITEGVNAVFEMPLSNGGTPLQKGDTLVSDAANFSIGDVVTVKDGGGAVISSITVSATTTVSDLINGLASEQKGVRVSLESGGALRFETAQDGTLEIGGVTRATFDATPSGWYDPAAIDVSLEDMKAAQEMLRLQAVTFGTNLTMLENRQDFMKQFSSTLLAGSEKILASDKNEEAANLLALQLRQQFSSSALSFATEADQGILRLLGG